MPLIHVFVGPTLACTEPALTAPDLRVLPPARHGDLFDPAIVHGDTVVLLDGVYHQAPALRHKEILAALARGVRVIGAASIGALRAAELRGFGMRGSGRIYEAYVEERLAGDDEVAVGQAPDGDLRALTWPLVTLRHIIGMAEQQGILAGSEAEALLRGLAAVYYPNRSTAAVLSVCRSSGADRFGEWLLAHRRRDPHWGDLKRQDALGALDLARELLPYPPQRPAANAQWDTGYFRAWANRFAHQEVDGVVLATSDRVAYQQIFDPEFPSVWKGWLEHCSLYPSDGSAEPAPLGARLDRLLDQDAAQVPAPHMMWHPRPDLRDPEAVDRLLARETSADRRSVARYTAANAHAGLPIGFAPEAIRDAVAVRTLLELWHTDAEDFENTAAARGFPAGQAAVEAMKRFLAGFLADTTQGREAA